MKVNDVTPSVQIAIDTRDVRNTAGKTKETGKSTQVKDNAVINSWQKDILLQAIDELENNIQPDNSHPLTRSDYRPIDNFHEALVELSFLKNPQFKAEAYQAQANIKPEDVSYLFTSN